MGHVKNGLYETEAKETVHDLLDTYDVPPELRQEVEIHCLNGAYFDALELLIEHR